MGDNNMATLGRPRFGWVPVILTAAMLFCGSVTAAASDTTVGNPCPTVSFRQRIPAPPAGFAAVIVTRELANCTLQVSGVSFVAFNALRPGANSQGLVTADTKSLPSVPGGSTSATTPAGPLSPSHTLQGHSRTWDQVGILLTELDTTETWTYNGSQVLSANAQDTVYYKSENPPPGWYLDTHSDWWSGGCFGCFSVQLTAHAGFGYNGFFDHTGRDYYNDHYNYLTVEGNGAGYCEFVVNWRKSLGFQHQNWCTGPY